MDIYDDNIYESTEEFYMEFAIYGDYPVPVQFEPNVSVITIYDNDNDGKLLHAW